MEAPAAAPSPAPAPSAAAPEPVKPRGGVAAVSSGPAVTGGSTCVPARIVDYFAVMVPTDMPQSEAGDAAPPDEPHELDSDAEDVAAHGSPVGGARKARPVYRRRLGHIQFRYPKQNHADVPLPDNMDWFIFPNGIAPVLQSSNVKTRPPTRRSVFVLSNVGGSALATTMYGCCLTAYRVEEESRDDEDDNFAKLPPGSRPSETKWWPVVLFMLSRFPIVPQLQVILEKFYDTYDRGCSTGAAEESSLPVAFASLTEYLRMLVYEAPVPIRRMNLAVQLFLPGERPRLEPAEDAVTTLYLPPPDALPGIQFDSRALLQRFEPTQLLQLMACMVLEQRLVVVAHSVEQIVETVEVAMALLYPLAWDLPYIPVLPAHLAADLLSSPVPFCYGLLTSYAARVFMDVSPSDASEIVVVDVTTGHVDRGVDAYLQRRAARLGVSLPSSGAVGSVGELPTFPEPLRSEMLAELPEVCVTARSPSSSAASVNAQLQLLFCRFFAVLLHGYRSSTFFPGMPPQYHSQLSVDTFVDGKVQALVGAGARARVLGASSPAALTGDESSVESSRTFLRMLCETQSLQRLLQRHTSIHLRPFHALTSTLSASPSLSETRKWSYPTAAAVYTLVVPPPGYASLYPWQIGSIRDIDPSAHIASVYNRQLPPDPASHAALPPPVKVKRNKKEKKEEADLARHFSSGEIAAAVGMTAWEAQELELLAAASSKGNNGVRGDDVGGAVESSDAASLSETAMLFTAAAEAAGSNSNPVVGRRGTAPAGEDMRRVIARQRAKDAAAARAGVKSTKRGWFRGGAVAATGAAKPDEASEHEQEEQVHTWLHACLVTGAMPAGLLNASGVHWSPDDEKLSGNLASPVVRASFVKVLQAQVLLAAGLAAPLAGAIAGDSVQLQPLLGLGVSEHTMYAPAEVQSAASTATTFRGPSGNRAARSLLVQNMPLPRFLRLAALCAVMLAKCANEKDYSVAAALLQLSFFFYTELPRDVRAGRAVPGGRVYLSQELALEPVWRHTAFWDAYVALALAVEEQQIKALHMNAQLHGVAAAADATVPSSAVAVAQSVGASGMTFIYTLLQTLLGPMLQMGVFPQEVRAWVSRCCSKYRVQAEEERTVLALVESLAAAEASNNAGGSISTLCQYAPFVRGNALATAQPIAAASTATTGATPPVDRSATPSTPQRDVTGTPQRPKPAPSSLASPPAMASEASGSAKPATTADPAAPPTAIEPALPTAKPVPESHADGQAASASGEHAVTATVVASLHTQPTTAADAAASTSLPAPAPTPGSHQASQNATGELQPARPDASALPAAPAPAAVPQHLWASMSAREAELNALVLVGQRRFPPVPDFAIMSRPKSFRGKPPATGSAVSKSSVQAATHTPSGGVDAAGAAAHAAASAGSKAPATQAPAAPSAPTKAAPIVKAFGSTGLSVIASSFAAALPGGDATAPAGAPVASFAAEESLLDGMLHTIVRAAIRASLGPGAITAGAERLPAAVSMSCLAFRGHATGAAVTSMSHDAEDHRVVTGGNDGRVVLWDMSNRTFLHAYEEHTAAVTAVRLCGDVVVSASQDGSIRVSSFARLGYKQAGEPSVRAPAATAPAAAPGSAPLFSGTATSTTSAHPDDFDDDEDDGEGDVEEDKAQATTPASAASAAAAASSAAYLAGGSDTAPAPAPTSKGASGVSSFANALSNMTIPFPFPIPSILGASGRGSHKFMSAVRLKGHSGPVTAVDVWERPEEKRTSWFSRKARSDGPSERALPCTSNYIIVSGGSDGSIRTWAARWTVNRQGRAKGTALHLSTISSLHKPGTSIEQLKLSVDGRLCASAGRDGRIGVVDVATGKTWVMMMPSASRGLFTWGATPATPIDPIAAPTGLPLVSCSIDVTRRPVTVTSAGADGTVRVWDLRTGSVSVAFPAGQPVWSFTTVPAHGGGAPTLDADGTPLSPAAPLGDYYLLSGHEDGVLRKWDSRRPTTPLAAWAGHASAIVSVSSLGDKVVTGCVDGAVRVWDAATGVSLRCDGHTGSVSCTSVSDDYFLTSAWDGTLRCWFPAT